MSCEECGGSLPNYVELLQKYCSRSCRHLAKKKRKERISTVLNSNHLLNNNDGHVVLFDSNYDNNDAIVIIEVEECVPQSICPSYENKRTFKRFRDLEDNDDVIEIEKGESDESFKHFSIYENDDMDYDGDDEVFVYDNDDDDDDVQLYDSFEYQSKSFLNLKSSFVITSEYDDDDDDDDIFKHNNDGKVPIQGTARKNKMFKKLNVVEAQSFIENAAEKSHEFTASALKHQHTSYVCFQNFYNPLAKL